MKIGYVLFYTEKKPAGIDRFLKGCIDEIEKNSQLDLNILGYDYLNLNKCASFPALYHNYDILNRYNELRVLSEALRLDIIHSFYFPFTSFKNTKSVLTIHDLIALVNANWFQNEENIKHFFNHYLRQAAKDADCILANSKHTKSDIVKYYDINPEKIKVIYPGFYKSRYPKNNINYREVLEKYKIDKDYILSICTIEPRKNLLSLIKAYEILRDKRSSYNVKLVLTGRKGWKNDEIYITAAKSKYSSDIVFTEYVQDYELDVLYRNALVFSYISYYEGFGLPILEAMAKGAAVLSSGTSSMPEVGGDAVCYCDPYNMDSIVGQLDRLIYDGKLRNNMKRKAIAQAKKFSYKKMADETIQVYHELMAI